MRTGSSWLCSRGLQTFFRMFCLGCTKPVWLGDMCLISKLHSQAREGGTTQIPNHFVPSVYHFLSLKRWRASSNAYTKGSSKQSSPWLSGREVLWGSSVSVGWQNWGFSSSQRDDFGWFFGIQGAFDYTSYESIMRAVHNGCWWFWFKNVFWRPCPILKPKISLHGDVISSNTFFS